ncbi:helix-turn-helix domain-containing protein [Tsuneonella flava]|uniref:Helix-turn-helix domain-containing protein n=1 Tax=Tsuneonella flava TaxID=2055955 RepID=A0ABX7K6H9_9SPHN|nr:helix-turn-helix domain-containing protein [Tsuneonella flava]QSB43850.1 helix-turn-helix domain-containing protein [Tsuneonella flava]
MLYYSLGFSGIHHIGNRRKNAQGGTIDLCLVDDVVHRAKVVWVNGSMHGCEFDHPLSDTEFQRLPNSFRLGGTALKNEQIDVSQKETFGERLRRLRTDRAMSQSHLARQLGVSKVTVWNWEKDSSVPRSQSLEQLAEIFRCSVRELLFGGEANTFPDDKEHGSLREALDFYKTKIATVAGVSTEDVTITISFSN